MPAKWTNRGEAAACLPPVKPVAPPHLELEIVDNLDNLENQENQQNQQNLKNLELGDTPITKPSEIEVRVQPE